MFPSPEKTSGREPENRNFNDIDSLLSELNEPKQVIESSQASPGGDSPNSGADTQINNGYDEYLENEPTAKLSKEAAIKAGKIAAATVDNLAGSGMAAYARNNEQEKYQATPKQMELLSENWAAYMEIKGSVIEKHPGIILAINNLAIYGSHFRTARIDKELAEMNNKLADMQKQIDATTEKLNNQDNTK